MRERLLNYQKRMDELLETSAADTDWDEVRKEHLIQIGFFMHERLIHLIVTVLFAILTVASVLYAAASPSIFILLLIVCLLCLMIPYIRHYYLLENGVQYLYKQYDRMTEKAKKQSAS